MKKNKLIVSLVILSMVLGGCLQRKNFINNLVSNFVQLSSITNNDEKSTLSSFSSVNSSVNSNISNNYSSTSSSSSKSSTSSSSSSSSTSSSISSSENIDEIITKLILSSMVIDQDNSNVEEDFELFSDIIIDYQGIELKLPVNWTSDQENINIEVGIDSIYARVIRPEINEDSVKVKLTALCEYKGNTLSKTFVVTVLPKTEEIWGNKPLGKIMTWEEYRNAEFKTQCTIQGIVTAAIYLDNYSRGNVFLQDANGGYFVNGIDADKSDFERYLAIGNNVIIEGSKEVYYGMHGFSLLSTTGIKVVDKTGVRPESIDITEDCRNNDVDKYQSMWVSITGEYEKNSAGDHAIKVGDYIYPIYNYEKYNQETYKEMENLLNNLIDGDKINLKGLVGCWYNVNFYPYEIQKI